MHDPRRPQNRQAAEDAEGVAAYELNVSCPNVETGLVMGADPFEVAALLGGLDELVNNASTLGPVPLRLLAVGVEAEAAAPLQHGVAGGGQGVVVPFQVRSRAMM